jgi:hypothetical protein
MSREAFRRKGKCSLAGGEFFHSILQFRGGSLHDFHLLQWQFPLENRIRTAVELTALSGETYASP